MSVPGIAAASGGPIGAPPSGALIEQQHRMEARRPNEHDLHPRRLPRARSKPHAGSVTYVLSPLNDPSPVDGRGVTAAALNEAARRPSSFAPAIPTLVQKRPIAVLQPASAG